MRYLLFFFSFFIYTIHAQNKNAVFEIYTYNKDNTIKSKGYGFFINNNEGVASYQLLKNAYRAEVIDSKDKKSYIHRILGANATTDLVKFSINSNQQHKGLSVIDTASVNLDKVYMINYTKGKQLPLLIKINKTQDFLNYNYFDLDIPNNQKYFGCPILNEKGEVIGIVQKNPLENAQNACGIDSRFIKELNITATSLFNQDLKSIFILKALPKKEKDALSLLYLMNKNDSTTYLSAINDFLDSFPNNPEGYIIRGNYYGLKGNLNLSRTDFETAFKKAQKEATTTTPDQVLYDLSKLIYTLYINNQLNTDIWTINSAIENLNKAYQLKPQPLYLMLKAHCLFAAKKYHEAFLNYQQVNQSSLKSSESFFAAATCLLQEKKDSILALSLLDSCIQKLPTPISKENASYIYSRAQLNYLLKKYRQAVFDYNEYEKIIGPSNLTALFYYIREQAEKGAKMYKQALDDIRFAQTLSQKPEYYDYRIEEALLLLQISEYSVAIKCAEELLKELPDNSDCYKIIGLGYALMQKKDDAKKYFQKAHDLGDSQALQLMDKYK